MAKQTVSGNRSRRLCDALEEEIVYGKLAPGARLDEVSLAGRFGVSRTPIREALLQLASSGMVELRPRRGAVVAEVGPHRLYEMIETMAELEASCARLAARRMSEEERQAFRKMHEASRAAAEKRSSETYFERNEKFHQALFDGSQNEFLANQARALQRRLRPFRRLQLRVGRRITDSFREHENIVKAVLAGDAERAAEAVRAHVTVQGERFGDLVSALSNAAETRRLATYWLRRLVQPGRCEALFSMASAWSLTFS